MLETCWRKKTTDVQSTTNKGKYIQIVSKYLKKVFSIFFLDHELISNRREVGTKLMSDEIWVFTKMDEVFLILTN